MNDLDLGQVSINDLILHVLQSLDRAEEIDRILNSGWTKIRSNRLISLDLSKLGIAVLDSALFNHPGMSEIEFLYLQGNQIATVGHSVFASLPCLRGLNMPNNSLETISNGMFYYLSNLEWLNLSSNSITKVEDNGFAGLDNLGSLNLSHNQITHLMPDSLAGLGSLTKLNLFNNQLRLIDGPEFVHLESLVELHLQSNRLLSITDDFPSFVPNLEKLYLKHNPAYTGQHSFETRYDILEMFRSTQSQKADMVMTELLNFEDDHIIATFNQLIEDHRWDGGIGRVSNYKLSQVTGIPIEVIAKKIETLIAQQKLVNIVHFDNNNPTRFDMHYWIRKPTTKGSINTGINEPKCLWCNVALADPFDACPSCGLRCEICKFSIKQTQEFDVCTAESDLACLNIFHRSEFVEWVKIYESCPNCGQDIDLNLYQVSKDYSQKVGALVEQDMELPADKDSQNNEFLIPMALSILINLKKISKDVNSSEKMIREFGKEAREQHQQILEELQPLATEIVLITAFLDRLEANTLTEKSFKASIDRIAERFDIFEENIDLIYEAHQNDKTKLEKIKEFAKKGTVKGGDVGAKALVERSGLFGKIKEYIKMPTKDGLKSILGRIGRGIRDTTGDPTAWIKLGAVFLL